MSIFGEFVVRSEVHRVDKFKFGGETVKSMILSFENYCLNCLVVIFLQLMFKISCYC